MEIQDFWDLVLTKHNAMPVYYGTTVIQTSKLTTMGVERPINRMKADLSGLKKVLKQTKQKKVALKRSKSTTPVEASFQNSELKGDE